ncbi:hypothetical protein BGX31_002739 [Mortierella sp. GBA43]|nr:hypothetical protein BGX31_002739 [Mortierella sp. GBA43]
MSTRPENSHANTTFQALAEVDKELSLLKDGAYSKSATIERFNVAKAGLEAKGFKVTVAQDKDEAFGKLKSLIPDIGFIDCLKGETPYDNIRAKILAEKDQVKQAELRRVQGITVDYFLTSVSAITENGEMAHGDFSGNKVDSVVFGAKNVIVVVGSNKIVKDEAEAFKRTIEWCVPFAGAYMREIFKLPGTQLSHYHVIRQANPFNPGRIQVLFINEAPGA